MKLLKDDWRLMRKEIARVYDSSATVQQRYPFKTSHAQIGGVVTVGGNVAFIPNEP